jgi:hypothetical protein
MVLLLRSNDVVFLNWITVLLEDAGVPVLLLDQHASIMDGSIGAIPRRVMVPRDDVALAREVLQAADVAFEQDPTYD